MTHFSFPSSHASPVFMILSSGRLSCPQITLSGCFRVCLFAFVKFDTLGNSGVFATSSSGSAFHPTPLQVPPSFSRWEDLFFVSTGVFPNLVTPSDAHQHLMAISAFLDQSSITFTLDFFLHYPEHSADSPSCAVLLTGGAFFSRNFSSWMSVLSWGHIAVVLSQLNRFLPPPLFVFAKLSFFWLSLAFVSSFLGWSHSLAETPVVFHLLKLPVGQ